MDDHPSPPSRIDLVFEALALLAGEREAARAISRSELRKQHGDERPSQPLKELNRSP